MKNKKSKNKTKQNKTDKQKNKKPLKINHNDQQNTTLKQKPKNLSTSQTFTIEGYSTNTDE